MRQRATTTTSSSTKSSYDSTFSRSSNHSYSTDASSLHDDHSVMKQSSKTPVYCSTTVSEPDDLLDETLPRSSVETYASTLASRDDLPKSATSRLPKTRSRCFAPDAVPSTPGDFAKLFPSTRRLLIQHDDSTRDGNLNLRVDTEVTTKHDRLQKMTLFYLRLKHLEERQFSLRRYSRDSGREVASCKRQYVKPVPQGQLIQRPNFQRSLNNALQKLGRKQGLRNRSDSGYESDDDTDEDLEYGQAFTAQIGVEATVKTSAIRLEFCNYAQVIVESRRSAKGREWGFEYWGNLYSWRRHTVYDNGELIESYLLVNAVTGKRMAGIMPDMIGDKEAEFESSQGAWIPASSMRLLDDEISSDLGDVIVATGLIALTDNHLRRL